MDCIGLQLCKCHKHAVWVWRRQLFLPMGEVDGLSKNKTCDATRKDWKKMSKIMRKRDFGKTKRQKMRSVAVLALAVMGENCKLWRAAGRGGGQANLPIFLPWVAEASRRRNPQEWERCLPGCPLALPVRVRAGFPQRGMWQWHRHL